MTITYVDGSVEEAMSLGKNGQHKTWSTDAWVSTYTAIKAGERAGVSTDVEKSVIIRQVSLLDILRDRKLIEEEHD